MIERLEMKLTFNYCCSSYFPWLFLCFTPTNLATTMEKAEFSSNNDNERFHDLTLVENYPKCRI